MFCSIASSPRRLPARTGVLRALSGVWADCLPACLLSICQCCGHAGEKGGEIAREHRVCVCVCAGARVSVCVPSEGVGTARHPSGGTTTGPICQPKQRDRPEQLRHRLAQARLTSPLHLPLISLFPLSAILLCIHPVITLLCYRYPSLCCLSSPSILISILPLLWEQWLIRLSREASPPLTANRWACLLSVLK